MENIRIVLTLKELKILIANLEYVHERCTLESIEYHLLSKLTGIMEKKEIAQLKNFGTNHEMDQR